MKKFVLFLIIIIAQGVLCCVNMPIYPNVFNVADFGASPSASAAVNTVAINNALAGGKRTVIITTPGVYQLNNTLFLDDSTELICEPGVILKKTAGYSFVLLNRGALTRSFNRSIKLSGVEIMVNGMELLPTATSPLFGLRGEISFFYAKDIEVYDLKILDLGTAQWAIQFCTFENIVLDGFSFMGNKDGVHLGRGSGFVIKNGDIETYDDAIALNSQDYPNCNPEIGDIKNGYVENVTDKSQVTSVGYFVRGLLGAWPDWHPGIPIQIGDAVVSNGNVYRAINGSVNRVISTHQPTHLEGVVTGSDGIMWRFTQADTTHSANIENVQFINLRALKNRTLFGMVVDTGNNYNRSVHSEIPHSNYPYARNLTFNGLYSEQSSGALFVHALWTKYSLNIKNITMAKTTVFSGSTTDNSSIHFENCDFSNISKTVLYIGGAVNASIKNSIYNTAINCTFWGGVRMNTYDNLSSISGLAPVKGDHVRYQGILYIYNGSYWEQLIGNFSGKFAPFQWEYYSQNSNGILDTSRAPAELRLTNSQNNSASFGYNSISIPIPTSGVYSFKWKYKSNSGTGQLSVGYIIDGIKHPFFLDTLNASLNGHMSINLTENQVFGWYTQTENNLAPSDTLIISSFLIPASELPVELITLQAHRDENSVKLLWTTVTELNNSGFEIQRSNNKLDWKTIGFVKGFGNSNSPKNYEYFDTDMSEEKIWYRLLQIDFSGKVTLSPVISTFNKNNLQFQLNQNYPNPFNSQTVIEFTLPSISSVSLELFTITGEKIEVIANQLYDAGKFAYLIDAEKLKLTSNIYFCRLIMKNVVTNQYNSKVTKMVYLK